jgi:hypothetical protein
MKAILKWFRYSEAQVAIMQARQAAVREEFAAMLNSQKEKS